MTDPFTWAEGNALVNALGDERWLAQRVQSERQARGWSQQRLSKELGIAGHPLQQSAISKIESAEPGVGRTITIGEAVGFAKVFGIPLGELLLPPDAVRDRRAWHLFLDAAQHNNDMRHSRDKYQHCIDRIANGQPGDEFKNRLVLQRQQVLERSAAELRDIARNDGDPDDYYSAEVDPPPMVQAIDDILKAITSGDSR